MEIPVIIRIDVTPRLEALFERLIAALASSAGREHSPPVVTHVAPCAPAGGTGQPSATVDATGLVSIEGEHLVEWPRPAAAPVVDQVPPPSSVTKGGIVRWSLERDAVLHEGWAAGTPTHILEQKINSLPGAVVQRDRIAIRASALGLRRPAGAHGTHPAKAVTVTSVLASVPPVSASKPVPVVDGVQEADVEAIRTWAGQRGLPFDRLSDLDRLNAQRRSVAMKPFGLSFIPKAWR